MCPLRPWILSLSSGGRHRIGLLSTSASNPSQRGTIIVVVTCSTQREREMCMRSKFANREGLGEIVETGDSNDEEREQVSEKGNASRRASR